MLYSVFGSRSVIVCSITGSLEITSIPVFVDNRFHFPFQKTSWYVFKLEKGEYGLSHDTVKEVLERLMIRRFLGANGAVYDNKKNVLVNKIKVETDIIARITNSLRVCGHIQNWRYYRLLHNVLGVKLIDNCQNQSPSVDIDKIPQEIYKWPIKRICTKDKVYCTQ